jgi:hypothetical protein
MQSWFSLMRSFAASSTDALQDDRNLDRTILRTGAQHVVPLRRSIADGLFDNFFVGGDFSVANENDAMSVLGDVQLVGDQDDGVALTVKVFEQVHDFFASF